MDLKLGECSHHSERIFTGTSGVIRGHPGVIICLGLFMVHGCNEKQPV